MAIEEINTGSSPNSRDGDSLRASFQKVNSNFIFVDELLSSSIELIDSNSTKVTEPPVSCYGAEGDMQHQIAIDQAYLYYCVADYVGDSTSIWNRIPWFPGEW